MHLRWERRAPARLEFFRAKPGLGVPSSAWFRVTLWRLLAGLDQIDDQNRNKGGAIGVPVTRRFFR
jgi:hypothetical protein